MKELGEKKIIFYWAGVIAALIFLVWFSFFYQTEKIMNRYEDIQRAKLETAVQEEKRDKISQLRKDMGEIENQKKRMESMYVSQENQVELFRILEQAASDTKVRIQIESYDLKRLKIAAAQATLEESEEIEEDESEEEAENPPPAGTLPKKKKKKDNLAEYRNMLGLSVEAKGDYRSIIGFLDKMEGAPYFIHVLVLDIVPVNKREAVNTEVNALVVGDNEQSGKQPEEGQSENELKMNLTVAVSNE